MVIEFLCIPNHGKHSRRNQAAHDKDCQTVTTIISSHCKRATTNTHFRAFLPPTDLYLLSTHREKYSNTVRMSNAEALRLCIVAFLFDHFWYQEPDQIWWPMIKRWVALGRRASSSNRCFCGIQAPHPCPWHRFDLYMAAGGGGGGGGIIMYYCWWKKSG